MRDHIQAPSVPSTTTRRSSRRCRVRSRYRATSIVDPRATSAWPSCRSASLPASTAIGCNDALLAWLGEHGAYSPGQRGGTLPIAACLTSHALAPQVRAGGLRTSRIAAVVPEPDPVHARALRFEQSVVTVALLAGFVFGVPWTIPSVAVVLAAATVDPRANVLRRAYDALSTRPPDVDRAGEPADVTRLT